MNKMPVSFEPSIKIAIEKLNNQSKEEEWIYQDGFIAFIVTFMIQIMAIAFGAKLDLINL